MSSQNASLLKTTLNVVGAVTFASSFFVEDNKKAVKRRWISLGIFAASYGVHVVDVLSKTKKPNNGL